MTGRSVFMAPVHHWADHGNKPPSPKQLFRDPVVRVRAQRSRRLADQAVCGDRAELKVARATASSNNIKAEQSFDYHVFYKQRR
jgi:hypothetical protein